MAPKQRRRCALHFLRRGRARRVKTNDQVSTLIVFLTQRGVVVPAVVCGERSMVAGPTKTFPVVCVGGSAGGLDAYIRLLKNLPADMGVAIVIVNHLRQVDTLLDEILPRYTQMPVERITEGLDLRPNHVFIIPPPRDLHVLDGEFRLEPISKPRGMARCHHCLPAIPHRELGRQNHRGHCFRLRRRWGRSALRH
jgi:chemotaxis response regulator CheB